MHGCSLGCLAIILTLMTLVPVEVALERLITWSVLTYGTNVDARVTRLWTTPGARTRKNYHVAWSYTEGGTEHSGEAAIWGWDFERMQEGSTLRLCILRIGPWERKVVRNNAEAMLSRSLNPVYGWTAFTLYAYIILYCTYLLERRIVRRGAAAPGTLVGKTARQGRENPWRVEYTFQPLGGGPRTAGMNVSAASAGWVEKAHQGDQVVVMYFPSLPWLSVVYECSQYEMNIDEG